MRKLIMSFLMTMFVLGTMGQPISLCAGISHSITKIEITSMGMGVLTSAQVSCDDLDKWFASSPLEYKTFTFENEDSIKTILNYIDKAELLDSNYNRADMDARGMIPLLAKTDTGVVCWGMGSMIDARARIVLYTETKTDTLYAGLPGILLKKGKLYETKELSEFIEKYVDPAPHTPKVIHNKRHSATVKRRTR